MCLTCIVFKYTTSVYLLILTEIDIPGSISESAVNDPEEELKHSGVDSVTVINFAPEAHTARLYIVR